MTFNGPGQYQNGFFQLGHGGTGWVTADGFVPVDIPGGVLWWMNDTMMGTPNSSNSVPNSTNSHNTAVQQGGGCLTPKLGNPEMIANSGGAWYWPGSAVVSGNEMLVFSYRVSSGCGSGAFNFCVNGVSVTRHAYPSLQLLSGPSPMPANHPSAPKGGGPVLWGARSFLNPADGMVYLYGTAKYTVGSFPTSDTWLARAPFNAPTSLQYFTNPAGCTGPVPAPVWSGDFGLAQPMTFCKNSLPDGPPYAQFGVDPDGGYLGSAFSFDALTVSTPIWAWTSDTPWGPWHKIMNGSEPQTVAASSPRTPDHLAYDARVTTLPGSGWTAVYAANDPSRQVNDFTLYRGEFRTPSGVP